MVAARMPDISPVRELTSHASRRFSEEAVFPRIEKALDALSYRAFP